MNLSNIILSGETKIIYEFIVYDLKNIYNEVNNPPYNYRIYEDYDECLIEGIKSAIDKYKSLKR